MIKIIYKEGELSIERDDLIIENGRTRLLDIFEYSGFYRYAKNGYDILFFGKKWKKIFKNFKNGVYYNIELVFEPIDIQFKDIDIKYDDILLYDTSDGGFIYDKIAYKGKSKDYYLLQLIEQYNSFIIAPTLNYDDLILRRIK